MFRYPFWYKMKTKKQVEFTKFNLFGGCGGRI